MRALPLARLSRPCLADPELSCALAPSAWYSDRFEELCREVCPVAPDALLAASESGAEDVA